MALDDADEAILRKRVFTLETELTAAQKSGDTKTEIAELRRELKEEREALAAAKAKPDEKPDEKPDVKPDEEKASGEWWDHLWPFGKKKKAE